MKKVFAIMLTVIMVITLVSAVACNATKSVRVIVYTTETSDPFGCMHVVGEDDLPVVTNGAMVFDGWFYDKAFTQPFNPNRDDNGQIVYARWKQADDTEQPVDKLVLTLDPDFAGAQKTELEIDVNSTYSLPDYSRTGYTFVGWFTERNGNGIQWTNSMTISASMTFYAYWTQYGSNQGDDNPVTPDGVMEAQYYNANTFDKKVLQDKLTTAGKYPDPAIGLPSTGTYTALVIPVKFSNTTISNEQLSNLNIAFNGTSEQTGWESVKTYYNKASYGQLNLSFDIAGFNMTGIDYYTSSNKYSYYERLREYDSDYHEWYNNGDNVLLNEALAYYKDKLDLTKYDANGDGVIDAVYLIYSAPVDYSDDSFYWAYVTWDDDDAAQKYDGLDVYYYLFAGLDFMNENVQGKNTNPDYPIISGLKINASTYIHETGHLLGLDDYYDYYPNEGCDEGLGGADMMDYTVGDQNVYSKIMLGWLTPEIVTSTKTITINSSQAKGDAILVPLKFNNSYFCEYLLIDLYSARGLNELHASMEDTYLYDGAAYGVRIYHVTSWIENAYDNDFGSFTDNNNSISDIALIKLVEADGEKKFVSTDGYAASDDLWQAGDSLNDVFPNYARNDGKLLNFDITIDSVSSESATVTITFIATKA